MGFLRWALGLAVWALFGVPVLADGEAGEAKTWTSPPPSTVPPPAGPPARFALDHHEAAIALLLERKSYAALDWLAKRALSRPMSVNELAQYWRLSGVAWGRLGQGNEAQKAFSIALRIGPAFRLADCQLQARADGGTLVHAPAACPGALGPKLFAAAAADAEIRGPFQAALAALPAPAHALAVRYQVEDQPTGVVLSIREVVDDLKLVNQMQIVGKSMVWSESPETLTSPVPLVPDEGPWTIRLLDDKGHALWSRELGLTAPAGASSAHSAVRGLAIAGGASLAAGALLTLGANLVQAFSASQGKEASPEDPWVAGAMWTGAGLVAVGAGLVLYDLIGTEIER